MIDSVKKRVLASLKRVLASLKKRVRSKRLDGQKEPWVLKQSGWMIVLAITLTAAGAYISIFQLPKLLDADLEGQEASTTEMAQIKNSYRELGLKLTGGLAAIFAAALTSGRLELSRQRHQNEISGQITERYTRAVDQLGNEDPAVRLGGLFALERIALDSYRDRPTVCEVICAFIRYRRSPEVLTNVLINSDDGDRQPESEGTPRPLEVDVSTALSILRKGPGFWQVFINLRGAYLNRAYLVGAHLIRADLSEATLSEANLSMATLSMANLSRAFLVEANLVEADLSEANLSGADLSGADLTGADLTGADLTGADLTEANLTDVSLTPHQRAQAKGLADKPSTDADSMDHP